MNTEVRELNDAELEQVSGGKTVSYHDGFKFILHDNGDLTVSTGKDWITNNKNGEVQTIGHRP